MRRLLLGLALGSLAIAPAVYAQESCSYFSTNKSMTLEQHADELYKRIIHELKDGNIVEPFRYPDNIVTGVRLKTTQFTASFEHRVWEENEAIPINPTIIIDYPFGEIWLHGTYRPETKRVMVYGTWLEVFEPCQKLGEVLGYGGKSMYVGGMVVIAPLKAYVPATTQATNDLATLIYNLAIPHIGKKLPKN